MSSGDKTVSKALPNPQAPIPAWGTYRLSAWGAMWMRFSQSRSLGWWGRRLALWGRKLALLGAGEWIDGEAEGIRIRAGKRGNVSDRKFLFMPQFVDVREREFLRHCLTRGGTFVDIGANAGVYSLGMAQTYRGLGGGRVLAVEPNPRIAPRLHSNIGLNDLGGIVEVVDRALSDSEGSVTFTISSDNLGQSGMARAERGTQVTVATTTLLKLLTDRHVTSVDGLKIDIEGAEDQVLMPFLACAPDALLPRCIVIEDSRSTWKQDLMAAFTRRGYTIALEARMNLVLKRTMA